MAAPSARRNITRPALGFSRLVESIIDADTAHGNLAEQLGIPGANAGGAPGLTTISISGTTGLGDNNGSVAKVNNLIEIDQALSWVKGSHELKFGFNFLSTRFAFFTPPKPNGSFTFNGAYTGYGLADFLYGRPISSQIDVTKFFDLKRYRPSFYIQDNWRLTRKLSLNLGLRDDLVTPWKERHNRLAVFDPSNGGNLVPLGTPGYPRGYGHRWPLCQSGAARRLRLQPGFENRSSRRLRDLLRVRDLQFQSAIQERAI